MKQKLINTLLKLYVGISFISLCCLPEDNIKILAIYIPLVIGNFALASHLVKKWLKADWKKLDSMDFKID